MDSQSDKPSLAYLAQRLMSVGCQSGVAEGPERAEWLSLVEQTRERLAALAGAPAPVAEQADELAIGEDPISDHEQSALYAFTHGTPHYAVVRKLYRLASAHVNAAAPPSLPPEPDTQKAYPVVGVGKDLQTALPRWIPVSEGMPETGQEVLLWAEVHPHAVERAQDDDRPAPSSEVHMGNYRNSVYGPYLDDYAAPDDDRYVTHWMPLPLPPGELSGAVPSDKPDSSSASASPDAQAIEVLRDVIVLSEMAYSLTTQSLAHQLVHLGDRARSLVQPDKGER